MKRKKRNKWKTLDIVLIIVAVFLFAFISVMCWFFYKFQAVPDTLVTAVLGTGVAELIASALITMVKHKYHIESEDKNDTSSM